MEKKSLQDDLESERGSRAGADKACSEKTEQLQLLEKLLAEAGEEKDILQHELESERASRAATKGEKDTLQNELNSERASRAAADKTSMEQAEQLLLLQECLAEAQREIHSLHESAKAAGESQMVDLLFHSKYSSQSSHAGILDPEWQVPACVNY